MQIALALVITLVSSCALNVGYLVEHSVASKLPPLSARHPLHSARLLLGQRRWLLGFCVEATGWLLYVLALALAPLSLVQATAAGGIGILAVMVSRYRKVPLTQLERIGVALSVAGLVLLGISLAGTHGEGSNRLVSRRRRLDRRLAARCAGRGPTPAVTHRRRPGVRHRKAAARFPHPALLNASRPTNWNTPSGRCRELARSRKENAVRDVREHCDPVRPSRVSVLR
jgi:hypothetical protein